MTTPLAITNEIDRVLRILNSQKTITARVRVLKDNDSELLRKIMLYSYSPYIRFGLKVSTGATFTVAGPSEGLGIEDEDIWNFLDLLRTTTDSSASKMQSLERLFARCSSTTSAIILGILNKSVVVGLAASTVNKAYDKLIPVFNVQLAQKYTDRKVRTLPQYAEIKYDGLRAIGIIQPNDDVQIVTRTGRPIPAAAYFYDELRAINKAYKALTPISEYSGCVTDGELTGETFNEAVSTFRSDAVAVSGNYRIFDILPMEALTTDTFTSEPFEARRVLLEKVINLAQENQAQRSHPPLTKIIRSVSYSISSKAEIWNMYNIARAAGHEGLIIKDPKGKWTRKRSNDWMKMKAEESEDLRIIGAFEGEGEMVGTLGGLIVDRDGVTVRVGSGFTHEDRAKIWAMFLSDLELSNSGEDDPEEFDLIGQLAEVQYQEVTPDGSLRHPVFIRLRKDKNEVSF